MLLMLVLLLPADAMAKRKVFKGKGKIFDYIIVGFGAAGAVLARKLSDNFNVSVLVLEAGENNILNPMTLSPEPFIFDQTLVYDPSFAATYPILAPAGGAVIYSEGREWGGGAAHNDLQAVRGVPADYNQWAADSHNSQWLYVNMLPLMKALETYTPNDTIANPTQRGFSGPISITQNSPVSSDEFAIAMADVAGAPIVSDYNDALLPNVSTGAVQQFVTAGDDSRRSFSAFDFTPIGEVMDNQGRGLNGRKLRVMGNAVVTRVLFEGNRAVGVQYLRNVPGKQSEEINKVYACRQIILCAGAINTPKILMLSGIGDRATLEDLGIEVIVDNPNVGANLENQYGAIARLEDIEPMRHVPGGSILSFINAQPYMPADNVRRMQLIGVDIPEETIIAGFVLKPKSRGSVTITSKDPLIPAKVSMNMYTDGTFLDVGSDAYVMVSFFKIVREIAAAADHVVIYPTPEQYEAGDEALFAAALNPSSLVITYHNVGTARMGTSIENGVVDGNLNVMGVCGLKIADISAQSTIVSGNPCYSAYLMALVAAKTLGVPTPPIL